MDTPQPEDSLSNTRVDVVDPLFFSLLIPLNDIFHVALTDLDLRRKLIQELNKGSGSTFLLIQLSSAHLQPLVSTTCKLYACRDFEDWFSKLW